MKFLNLLSLFRNGLSAPEIIIETAIDSDIDFYGNNTNSLENSTDSQADRGPNQK